MKDYHRIQKLISKLAIQNEVVQYAASRFEKIFRVHCE